MTKSLSILLLLSVASTALAQAQLDLADEQKDKKLVPSLATRGPLAASPSLARARGTSRFSGRTMERLVAAVGL